jgi:hypothetical protein
MSALAAFQDAFAAALLDPDAADPRVRRLAAQPGFAVYRNTVIKGCVDALAANFPSVRALVGEEWLRAAAAVHARERLPDAPTLLQYGAHFPAFLAAFPPARELPYLAGVAACDRFRTEAHVARDEPPLDGSAVAALPAEALGAARLVPHAAARWAWFEDAPVAAIWLRTRDGHALDDLPWQADGILVTRPHDAVLSAALSRAGCAFMAACAGGHDIAAAARAALDDDPATDLSALMAQLVAAGAFTRIEPETSA